MSCHMMQRNLSQFDQSQFLSAETVKYLFTVQYTEDFDFELKLIFKF